MYSTTLFLPYLKINYKNINYDFINIPHQNVLLDLHNSNYIDLFFLDF